MKATAGDTPARVAVLSGGVGGAKFAAGLHALLPPGELAIIVNTADDFDHLGLRICPDVDSVIYRLADVHDSSRGWGRRKESWNCLDTLRELGADDWFALGDRDLAVHLVRSHSLRSGHSLADVTARLTKAYGISSAVIPMTESHVQTMLMTDEGELAMQDYFVRRRCQPRVKALRYEGVDAAELHPLAKSVLGSPELRAIFIAPSNPFLSIDPILALPNVNDMLRRQKVPVVAISPLIGGKSVKGPLSDMLSAMGFRLSSATIADHYGALIHGLVVDTSDAQDASDVKLPVLGAPTLMSDLGAATTLARAALDFAHQLHHG